MALIGSRALGVGKQTSNYDYLELDLENMTSMEDMTITRNKMDKTFHISQDFANSAMTFQLTGNDEKFCIYNAVNYKSGAYSINPLDNVSAFTQMLKNLDYTSDYFWNNNIEVVSKYFYFVVYDLECIRENTLEPNMDRVRSFYSRCVQKDYYNEIVAEIMAL